MKATILQRPQTFDRVDRVKQALIDAGHPAEPIRPGDNRLWILGSPLIVDIDSVIHTVPTGFTTDGASIPALGQALTGWTRWDPPQRWGGIVHDWLYTQHGTAKTYADHAFRAVLTSEHASIWKREIMYLAVVAFGAPAYHSDQTDGPMIYNGERPD